MKAVRFFDPLHAMGSPVTEADVDGLSLFKFYNHPKVRCACSTAHARSRPCALVTVQALLG